jgi:TolB-like protein
MLFLFDEFVLDTDRRELRGAKGLIAIEPQVFDLLTYLVRTRDRVVSKDDILATVWDGRLVSDSAMTTRINAARRAIGDSGEAQRFIKTLPRIGMRFVGAVYEEHGPWAITQPPPFEGSILPALPDRPSIAVLPFANMSGDPEQQYFSDGITEDIITELSRFRSLFVIARQSSFAFKGRLIKVQEIARELGVAFIVEGSVRRAGDSVLINVQLVDASSGNQLWAERYDRDLLDIFAVQDDVARSVAATISGRVDAAGRDRVERLSPTALRAYDLVLRAKA